MAERVWRGDWSAALGKQQCAILLFLFYNYNGFLIKIGVNFITHNIIRRFLITALEYAS